MTIAAEAPGGAPSIARAYYALGVLMIVTFTALLDRYLISLLLDPIRQGFLITDTQASLLQGLAFAMLYSILGLPFGRLVDRGNRRNIILAGVLLWSMMTMICGLAPNYLTLFAGRLGVGVGEACLAPAAYSYLTDCFPARRHGRAIALFTLGSIIGGGGSFIAGSAALRFAISLSAHSGLLAGIAPWRLTFIIVGIPGLLVALLMLTLREPQRTGVGAHRDVPSLVELTDFLRRIRRPFSGILVAGCAFMVAGTGGVSWLAVFLARTYSMPPTTSGSWIGIILIVSGLIAAPIAGVLADSQRIGSIRGEKLLVVLLGAMIAMPFVIAYPLAPTATAALWICFVYAIGYNIQACSLPSALQDILPNRHKGQVTALYWLCVGLVGFGGGATAVALVTDHVFANPADLRYAIMIVCSTAMAIGILAVLLTRPSYQRIRDAMQAEAASTL